MDPDSSSLIPLVFLLASLAARVLLARVEVSLAEVDRLERLQQVVEAQSPRPRTLRMLDVPPLGAAGVLSIARYVTIGTAVLSGASLALTVWDGNWFAMIVGGVVGLAAVAIAQFAAARPRRESNGNGDDMASHAETIALDLNQALDDAGEPLEEFEVRMIRGVVGLDMTTAREIMSPRVDVQAIEITTPMSGVLDTLIESGHSRLPVYRGDLDHIVGLVYAKDILKILHAPSDDRTVLTQDMLRDPLFIPETKTLEGLLLEFQHERVHIAIVVDEYGGVAGLVTIEDLLEEIVGEIEDEFDSGEPQIEKTAENEYIIDARTGLDDLRERLDVKVEADGFDTLGGLVYYRLGKIPAVGDAVDFDGMTIEVMSTVGRRLKKLKVVTRPDSSEPEDDRSPFSPLR